MDALAPTPRRSKRFERPADPKPMRLTPRDVAILGHVARHRLLSSKQLAILDGGSEQNLRRCLKALFDHGYLDRPKAQLKEALVLGNQPMVYGVTRKGARVLKEHGAAIDSGLDWSHKNRKAGSVFIQHTVAVGDFLARLEAACKARGDVELIDAAAIIAQAPEKTRKAREPLRWRAELGEDGEKVSASVLPDALFGLAFPDGTASYFLVEIDRGTMPIMRRGSSRTSFARKLAVYWAGWKQGRHIEQFGVKSFRVLTVTTSPERVANMVAAVKALTAGAGSNIFLFTSTGIGASPLDVRWMTGKGEASVIVD